MGDMISFKEGDQIKFKLDGYVPETAGFFLPKLRERTYFGVTITEKNGETIPPTTLEVGLYNNELPPHIKFTKKGEGIEIDGLDPGKYLTATLTGGFPRAREEDVGRWNEFRSVPFFVASTLQQTDEAVPASAAGVSSTSVESAPLSREEGTQGRRWGFGWPSHGKK